MWVFLVIAGLTANPGHKYVFFVHNDAYVTMTNVAVESVRVTDRYHSIVIMHTSNINKDVLHPLATKEVVSLPAIKGRFQWRETFGKLRAGSLSNTSRIILLDADLLVVRSLAHLFYLDPGKSIIAPKAYWLPQPFFMSGGPVIMNTWHGRFDDVLNLPRVGYDGEMDWLNHKFKGAHMLSHLYTLLIGEYAYGDKIYHYQGTVKQPYVIHFIASWKPPLKESLRPKLDNQGLYYYKLWDKYRLNVAAILNK